MKLYLADTISRELLGYHETLPILNHLESYYILKGKKKRSIDTWSIVKENNNETKKTNSTK